MQRLQRWEAHGNIAPGGIEIKPQRGAAVFVYYIHITFTTYLYHLVI